MKNRAGVPKLSEFFFWEIERMKNRAIENCVSEVSEYFVGKLSE
jgi:hypothetical protein